MAERVVSPLRGVNTLTVYCTLTAANTTNSAATNQRCAVGAVIHRSMDPVVYPQPRKMGKGDSFPVGSEALTYVAAESEWVRFRT